MRIEIGDAERVGDERARAGAAAGADRDAVVLGPVDEVGDDQEVAGEAHLDDGPGLELQSRDVLGTLRVARRRIGVQQAQAPLQPGGGFALQMIVERDAGGRRKVGQVALAERDREIAALRDRDRVRERLGQVAERRDHLRLRLEVLVRREAPRPPRVREHVTLGDADARLVRAEVLAAEELHRMRRHHRQSRARCRRARWRRRERRRRRGRRAAIRGNSGRERSSAQARAAAAAPRALPCSSAAPTSPSRAPDSAISPSVPSANQSRLSSARPRCWLLRYARVSHADSRR